jgi:hypothetical protein
MPTPKKTTEKFTYENNVREDEKDDFVRLGWSILEKMDPEGDLFVTDKGLVVLQGAGPDDRRINVLGFDEEEIGYIEQFAIPDATEADENDNPIPESITGVIFTTYNLIEVISEVAYQSGYEAGKAERGDKITEVLTEATKDDDDDDEYEYEEEEDGEETIEDEEEYDESSFDEDEEYI